MKVIKAPEEFKPLSITCPTCKADLEADKKDFTRQSGGDFRESWDYAVCTCPCCNTMIKVMPTAFPTHIYQALPRDTDR